MKILAAVLSLALCGAAGATDEQATNIAHAMMTAMGGQPTWIKAHFVRFDFRVTVGGKTVVDRSHLWDKQTGRYRLDGKDKQGQKTVALFNVNTQQGTAWVAGRKLEGSAAAAALKEAYGAFINDMYWLSMPWKWTDQGVHLKYLGRRTLTGKPFDVVELTFDHVGLTPGDTYQAFVSPATHLMEHWEYKLQGGNTGSWDWKYTTTGGVKLASDHTNQSGNSISMGEVRVTDTIDEALFTNPTEHLR